MSLCNYCGAEVENTTNDIVFGNACEKCAKKINGWINNVTSDKFKCSNCFLKRIPIEHNTESALEFVCPKCNSVMFAWDKDSDSNTIKKFVRKESDREEALPSKATYTEAPIRCPKCSSAQITTGSRGYSLAWGFIGAGKTVNRCARCGHKWTPRR